MLMDRKVSRIITRVIFCCFFCLFVCLLITKAGMGQEGEINNIVWGMLSFRCFLSSTFFLSQVLSREGDLTFLFVV